MSVLLPEVPTIPRRGTIPIAHAAISWQPGLQVSIILPVIDETTSLRTTVGILIAENLPDVSEILVVTCAKTTERAHAVCRELVRKYPSLIRIRAQNRPFLGGAIRDGFEWASGSHVLIMASDLETDPETVKDLLAAARLGYDIVTATRGRAAGGLHGHNPLKHSLHLMFQRVLGLLYGAGLSDMTNGFRIFRAEWVKGIEWEELRHAFLLESILKPMRLGARVAEVPTAWRRRVEGTSHTRHLRHLAYIRIALKTRFRKKVELLAGTRA
jgi:glycosyltransferase involved in cell wall biosynthesis